MNRQYEPNCFWIRNENGEVEWCYIIRNSQEIKLEYMWVFDKPTEGELIFETPLE